MSPTSPSPWTTQKMVVRDAAGRATGTAYLTHREGPVNWSKAPKAMARHKETEQLIHNHFAYDKVKEIRSGTLPGIRPPQPIRLYTNPDSSEVAGEYSTLHGALSANIASPSHGEIVQNGLPLAVALANGSWRLTRVGLALLIAEFQVKQ